MDLMITLPAHVAAVFTDADALTAWLVGQATAEHDRLVMDAAREEANAILAAASATLSGAEPPTAPTLAERVEAAADRIEEVASRTVLLAGTLATLPSVGGDPAEVQAAINEVVGGSE